MGMVLHLVPHSSHLVLVDLADHHFLDCHHFQAVLVVPLRLDYKCNLLKINHFSHNVKNRSLTKRQTLFYNIIINFTYTLHQPRLEPAVLDVDVVPKN